jgi:hypothetical protein
MFLVVFIQRYRDNQYNVTQNNDTQNAYTKCNGLIVTVTFQMFYSEWFLLC